MSALTQPRNTPRRIDSEYELPVAAGVVIYAGAIVAMENEFVRPAGPLESTGGMCIGVATETVDNSQGGNGEQNIVIARDGAFFFKHDGSVDYSSVSFCALDDQTLTAETNNGEDGAEERYYPHGVFLRQVTADGAWVKFGY